jgi:hypothetical protein
VKNLKDTEVGGFIISEVKFEERGNASENFVLISELNIVFARDEVI